MHIRQLVISIIALQLLLHKSFKDVMAHYIGVKEGALTIMLEWHGQYWISSDNIDFMARMRSLSISSLFLILENLHIT